MRTARNMFIVNLAVSDALVCCVGTPLTLMELLTKHWPLPDWPSLCKACGAIQAISIFVSTISITAIALDRYQVTTDRISSVFARFAYSVLFSVACYSFYRFCIHLRSDVSYRNWMCSVCLLCK